MKPGTATEDPDLVRVAAREYAAELLRQGHELSTVRRQVDMRFSLPYVMGERSREVPDEVRAAVRSGVREAYEMPDVPADERAREKARRQARNRQRREEKEAVAEARAEARRLMALSPREIGEPHVVERDLVNQLLQAQVVDRGLADWRVAELRSAAYMRALGMRMVEVTRPHKDGGIDVTADHAVAQVKHLNDPVGQPTIQQLQGAALTAKAGAVCFSRSGYTTAAIEYADRANIALFLYDADWSFAPANSQAKRLVNRRSGPSFPPIPYALPLWRR